MGKNKNKNKKSKELPLVSLCTPTFNRRPFIEQMIHCFDIQDYPKDKIEWIIVDDGTDKIEDLVKDIPQVKYYAYDEKMTLGKKRNLMHDKSTGDIIIYIDDDDYYPRERISHSVYMLQKNKNILIGGSSEMYIYFKGQKQLWKFGPYGKFHATAGTFAFKKELLNQTRYNEEACLAEEKEFLKGYTIPMVQFDPYKTILVVSHEHNTFDKRTLIENGENEVQKISDVSIDRFFGKVEVSKDFFMNKIDNKLKEYEPGRPEMKPDVLEQTKELKRKREEKMKKDMEEIEKQDNAPIVVETGDGKTKELTNREIKNVIENQLKKINELENKVRELVVENELLQRKVNFKNRNKK